MGQAKIHLENVELIRIPEEAAFAGKKVQVDYHFVFVSVFVYVSHLH